jgi:hypothetical protein
VLAGRLRVAAAVSATAPEALTLQLLEWVAARPRAYDEALDVWRTSCPRLSVWEDAVIGGFVECRCGTVHLTERGCLFLASAAA